MFHFSDKLKEVLVENSHILKFKDAERSQTLSEQEVEN